MYLQIQSLEECQILLVIAQLGQNCSKLQPCLKEIHLAFLRGSTIVFNVFSTGIIDHTFLGQVDFDLLNIQSYS